MGFYDQFPYTNFHELNLDWIVEFVNKARKDLETFGETYGAIKDKLAEHGKELQNLKSEIDENYADLSLQILNIKYTIQNFRFATIEQLEKRVQEITNVINANVLTLKTDIKLLYSFIEQDQKRQDTEWAAKLAELEKKIDAIELMPVQKVVNPITKQPDNIQHTLDMMYKVSGMFRLTAGEYDALGLTAGGYDSKNLTAFSYDNWGKLFLYYMPNFVPKI